jgi:hypothetical protein
MKEKISGAQKPTFVLATNRFLKRAKWQRDTVSRKEVKKLIKPENAQEVIRNLPAPGETVHAVLRGNFVLGDVLPYLLTYTGYCPLLRISSLSISNHNAETLRDLVTGGKVGRTMLIVSHWLKGGHEDGAYRKIVTTIGETGDIKAARCHAKMILIRSADYDLVLAGSANLRSCDSLEQITIDNDPDVYDFHAAWMDEMRDEQKHSTGLKRQVIT